MTSRINPLLFTDGYKTGHHKMYAPGTQMVYSNYTCRSTARMQPNAQSVVAFGMQYVFRYIKELWDENFFSQDKTIVCQEAKKYLSEYLMADYDVSHFEALHDLGYLPIEVRSLPEGSITKAGIPIVTIKNTNPKFFWVTNFLETLISTLLWKPIHSASLAFAYRRILEEYAKQTDPDNLWFVDFQAHDFSLRGMQHIEAGISSGMGFASIFKGSDTIPVLKSITHYYGDKSSVFSVNATEHSVMCSGSKDCELDTFRRLMQTFPKGILSVVSDTWDLWKVVTEYLPQLKKEILARDGKLTIRPDSGDPVDIICGQKKFGRNVIRIDDSVINIQKYLEKVDASLNHFLYRGKCYEITMQGGQDGHYYYSEVDEAPVKGLIELLWDTFGGSINTQGYKVLDPHIGAIYGDSITLKRAEQICERLKEKGFASTNIVFGVGSYSMGYATRDNQGGAVKSTAVVINNELVEIFKDPVTDDGTKKSAKGLLCVNVDDKGEFILKDQCSEVEEKTGELKTIFIDGKMIVNKSLEEIRLKIKSKL